MRRSLATLAVLIGALLVMPGVAQASGGLAITTGSDSGVTQSGTGDCTYVVNTTGASIINAGEIDTCLQDGNPVSITDPNGYSGSITVSAAIDPSSCSGALLTLDEEGGPIELDSDVDVGSCPLDLDASGSITQAAALTAGDLSVDDAGAGDVTLTNTGNDLGGEFSATADGALALTSSGAVTLNAVSDTGTGTAGDVTITAGGSIDVVDTLSSDSAGSTVNLTAAGSITQSSSAPITAATLVTSSAGATTLNSGASNEVGAFESIGDDQGAVDLYDDEAVALDGFNSSTGFVIDDEGDIDVDAELNAPGDSASLVSYGGSVTEDGGAVWANSLTALGDINSDSTASGAGTVSLSGTNYVNTLSVTAYYGNVSADLWEPAVILDDVEADEGSVSVTNGDGSLEPTGLIEAQSSISLDADGFTAASGGDQTLSAPTVDVTDTDSSDAWTVNGSTIAAEGTGSIAYASVSNLSITGAGVFNVTPSAVTDIAVNGGGTGALTYQAQGQAVSGTTTAPSGEIDSPGVDPVSFSGMATVTLDGLPSTTTGGGSGGTSGGGGTTTGGTTTGGTTGTITASSTPTCTLRAISSKVALPKRVHGKLKGKPTLTLVATCNSAVHVILSAGITVVSTAHGKRKSKYYPIPGIRASLAKSAAKQIVLDVPSGAVTALSTKGDKLSAMFTLADTDNGDSVLKTISIARLT